MRLRAFDRRALAPVLAAALGIPAACLIVPPAGDASAAVGNPDISVIGQPFLRVTNEPSDADREHPRFDPGETELVFDAALNPYARGFFALALADEGIELEEGFFTITRGLPAGLALKGGKYRVPFGRMNAIHPHALPFAERARVLQTLLPGEEAFNETGVSVSTLIGLPGDRSLVASADVVQGDSFRIAGEPAEGRDDREAESRPGYAARLAGFQMLGERSGIEAGVSAAGGTNNVAAASRSGVLGVDLKAKLWSSPRSFLVIQGEWIRLARDVASWTAGDGYATSREDAAGGYLLADYQFDGRVDAGIGYERYEVPGGGDVVDAGFTAFAGYALMEETLSFRADWYRAIPEDGDAADTFTLRAIVSMGPHKPHAF